MMTALRRLSVLLALPLLAACDGDGIAPREVVGVWQFTTETSAIEWRRDDIRLTLEADGTLLRTHHVYADDGREGDLLRAYTRTDGTYRLEGDDLTAVISRVEHRDVHEQAPRVEHPGTEERYRVRLLGDRMLLEENRVIEGRPVTYHHTFRRADETDESWGRPGR